MARQPRSSSLILFFNLTLLLFFSTLNAQTFRLQPHTDPNGLFILTDLNNKGDISAIFFNNNGNIDALLRKANGETITLPGVGGTDVRGIAINDSRQVAGFSTDTGGVRHAGVWDANGFNDRGDASGFGVMDTTTTSPTTSVDDSNGIPSGFELAQNYPNPFNPQTVIKYQTTQSSRVELAVYNLLGQKVRVLVNEIKPSGSYEARWDGTNDFGEVVSSGVYVYRLKSGEFESTKKMVFLR